MRMSRIGVRGPSPAMIVALLALFVALGGSAYAALTITGKNVKDGTLTSADLKNNAVKSIDIANGSLLAKDFKGGQVPAGAPGPPGPQGLVGPPGPRGERGDNASATEPLASGETESGSWVGADGAPADGKYLLSLGFFYPPLPAAVPAERIVYVDGAAEPHCDGIGRADRGYLCLYETLADGIDSAYTPVVYNGNRQLAAGPYGFAVLTREDTSTKQFYGAALAGVFTYTAP